MDQFEAARVKHAKNLERKERTQSNTAQVEEIPVVLEAPKEKKLDTGIATIEVVVTLPDTEHRYKFVKLAVYQNATRSKLTRNEFKNRITEGLRPLLGGLNELPFGGD